MRVYRHDHKTQARQQWNGDAKYHQDDSDARAAARVQGCHSQRLSPSHSGERALPSLPGGIPRPLRPMANGSPTGFPTRRSDSPQTGQVELLERLLPVVTFALGLVGSLVLESKRDARLAAREERAHERERRRAADDFARTFERDTLLELQDAVIDHARVVGLLHSGHVHHDRAGRDPLEHMDDDALSLELLDTGRRWNKLEARLGSDALREELAGVKASLTTSTMYGLPGFDMATCKEAMYAGTDGLVDALEHMGRRLRELTYGSAPATDARERVTGCLTRLRGSPS